MRFESAQIPPTPEQGGLPPTHALPTGCMRVQAPSHWKTLAFLSDVHLHAADRSTFEAWASAVQSMQADVLFILGDLFEVWVGDDVLTHPTEGPFWNRCAQVLSGAVQRMPVYFMPGNRDFLVASHFLKLTGLKLLTDPTLIEWPHARWLLGHGDLLCTDDQAYLAFRAQVRNPHWQAEFLSRPLDERLELARQMRMESAKQQAQSGANWVDVNIQAVEEWLDNTDATILIHGHTHMPAMHTLANSRMRVVLSDWDANATTPRTHWLEVSAPSAADHTPVFHNKNLL